MALIYLIGFMGCGKTTLGKKVANQLNHDFIDLDQLIEKRASLTINEFFTKNGEESFRVFEKQLLIEVSNSKNAVVAVGGGAPCFFNNMEIMNQTGETLYLQRPVKELYNRIINAKNTRPLVQNKNNQELLDFIEQLLNEREIYYSQAKFTVPRNNLSLNGLVDFVSENISIKL
jgi:shikimate kinase